MAPTGSRTTAARTANGTRGVMREWLRESGCGARPEPDGDTNRVPRCVTRMEPTPRCMCGWYRLSVFEQAPERSGLFLGDGPTTDSQVELS